MPMPQPSTVQAEAWPPNYVDVFAWRQQQVLRFRGNPALIRGAFEYYRTRPAEFINHWVDTYDPRNAAGEVAARIPLILFPRQADLVDFITAAGITSPDYSDILAELQDGYYSIYGSDAVLTSDSQDGQLLAIFAQAIYDAGQSVIAAYNSFSPANAQGAGLSSIVKINGISRKVPSNSQCVVTVIGQAGAQITNGVVGDNLNLGTQWALPALVTIPPRGLRRCDRNLHGCGLDRGGGRVAHPDHHPDVWLAVRHQCWWRYARSAGRR